MTIIKPILVTAAVLICCMGNEYPAKSYELKCETWMGETTCRDDRGNSLKRETWGGETTDRYEFKGGGSMRCRTETWMGTTTTRCD